MSDLHWSYIIENDEQAKLATLALEKRIRELEHEVKEHCVLIQTLESYMKDMITNSNFNFEWIRSKLYQISDKID